MANTTTTPNMNLVIPTVGVDPTPDYPTNINNDLTILDAHSHQPGSGVPITPLAININSDLSMGTTNNLNATRSVRFVNQGGTLAGANDIGSIYQVGGNLYYNNNAGVPVQITNGAIVNSTVTNNYVYSETAVASNTTIAPSDSFALLSVNTSSVAITITLPAASGVSTGRLYVIKDKSGNAGTHNITIKAAGSDTVDGAATFVMTGGFQAVYVFSDGSSNWSVLSSGKMTWSAGDVLTVAANATLTVDANATVSMNLGPGGTINGNAGSRIQINGPGVLQPTVAGGIKTFVAQGIQSNIASGLQSQIANGINSAVTGGIQAGVASGIQSGIDGGIQLSGTSADWVTFSTPRTMFLFLGLEPASIPSRTWSLDASLSPFNSQIGAIVQTATANGSTDYLNLRIPSIHNSATLTTVRLVFAVSTPHANVPANLPTMSVTRYATVPGASTAAVVGLSAGGAIPFAVVSTGAGWYSSGNLQAVTYTCNQNNVIDTSQYAYVVSILGEFGANSSAGLGLVSLRLIYTVPDTQF